MEQSSTRRRWRPRRGPNGLRLRWRRLSRRMRRTFSRMRQGRWTTSRRIGIEKSRNWRRRRSAGTVRIVVYLAAALLLLWVARGIWVASHDKDYSFGPDLEAACEGQGLSCGAVTGFILPWLSLALATALFLIVRLGFVPHRRRKTAKTSPHELVPTAGAISGRVVGRDELCKVVMESVKLPE